MRLLILVLFAITQTFAIDVVPIKKNDPSPKDGFFISKESLKEMRTINEKKKLLERENVSLKSLGTVNEERIEIYKEQAKKTQKALSWEHTKGYMKGTGGFILGVLATTLAAFAAGKAIKQ